MIQVSDFGLAKLSQDNNTHVSTRVMGTFGWENFVKPFIHYEEYYEAKFIYIDL